MIPVLYAGNETNFTSNGLGRLADAISCKVTEERNGIFELEMQYPITGVHYDEIQENRIIYARTEDGGNAQAFIIYRITRPINGIITIDAQHISYLLNGIPVMPFNASSLTDTMSKIASNAVISCPFHFYTNIISSKTFSFDVVRSIRSLLGGENGSILDVYGGYDYKFDNFNVRLLDDRGSDNGVSLRYGKNLTELKNITNMTNVYTGIVPYWQSEHETVYLTNRVVLSGHESDYPYKIIKVVDFSSDFDEKPTETQLLEKAQSYLSTNEGWKLKNNITVSFVNLSETEDYKDIAPLERVKLCDTINVIYSRLGVSIKTRVIKTVYNVLLERYDSIELGESRTDLTRALNETLIEQSDLPDKSFLKAAIENATKLIQGGLGGHVVFNTNANGEPEEILIMDTDDITTAIHVIRFNLGGIGFSSSGYNGPFDTAWTIDGSFYADFITAGKFNADLIQTGTIKDENNLNYWNMRTGEFKLSGAAKVGNSTVASKANIADGISNYNTSLDQQAVFNKLTNNGLLEGIYMEDGKLYINATYVKSGELNANLLTSGTIEDEEELNYWNLQTGEFKLSSAAKVGNSTVASNADVGTAIDNFDNSLDQSEVFDRLTDNGNIQGIYMQDGQLYVNGSYIKANSISANALTVAAQEEIKGTHDYLPYDVMSNASRFTYQNVPAPYYTTIDGKTYIALDGTGLSSYDTNNYCVLPSDYFGNPTISVKLKVRFSSAYTPSETQRFFFLRYKGANGSTYRATSTEISFNQGQTYPASDVEYAQDFPMGGTPAASNPQIGFIYQPNVIVYITAFEATSTVTEYQNASVKVTADGLSSVVQKGDVLSSINQSAEGIKIQAAKVDLTGDLDLHGTFTTDINDASSAYNGFVGKFNSCRLEFFDANDQMVTGFSPGSQSGRYLVPLVFYDPNDYSSGWKTYISAIRCEFPDVLVSGNSIFGLNASLTSTATFWSEVTFKRNVYDLSGGLLHTSDRRKKRSIKDLVIEKAKSFIMGLKPRKFKFRKDLSTSGRYHHGFIAQEVKEAMSEDWGVYVENKEKDFIGLRYDELIADMVAVIQDQEKRIDALERRMNDLTNDQS